MEILVAIESKGGARAAPDGPKGPNLCASSAHVARGSGCSCALHFVLPRGLIVRCAHLSVLGRSWVLGMCMLWVTAVRDLCLGAVWTRQPIGMG